MLVDHDGDGFTPLTNAEKRQRYYAAHKETILEKLSLKRGGPRKIAVLDIETDPFDNQSKEPIRPFLAILYSNEFDPIILWDDDHQRLMDALHNAIVSLPDRYIIYAHNGGRFDYMHFVHLLRGAVSFKGRAIMRASIGAHELRDSLHIIPEALKNAAQKDDIDYDCFRKSVRGVHRTRITNYCLADCRYTFDIVKAFVEKFGTPLTIGQAAMKELKKSYEFECLSERIDEYLRQWFFGGRVECITPGRFLDAYKLIDKNSMYPYCMSNYPHPIGGEFYTHSQITSKTVFITLRCKNNGALVGRAANGDLDARIKEGVFNTTVWEYEVALKHGLIRDVHVLNTINFYKFSDFSKFVEPLYEQRRLCIKARDSANEVTKKMLEKDIKFYKYLLNNAYGKFAQNPRRFRDYYLTEPNERPPVSISKDGDEYSALWGAQPEEENNGYWVWSQPAPEHRFNNVATAASITGAARAELLDAMQNVSGLLYCDTDSLVCRDAGTLQLDPYQLGGWKVEANINEFIGVGKKLYAYRKDDGKQVIKTKGVNTTTWQDMLDLVGGKSIRKTLKAPTLRKDGSQVYMTRELRSTVSLM